MGHLERLTKLADARYFGHGKPLVPDDLWAAIEPLLPVDRPKPKGGRPRLPDRAALTGIMFILTTGSP